MLTMLNEGTSTGFLNQQIYVGGTSCGVPHLFREIAFADTIVLPILGRPMLGICSVLVQLGGPLEPPIA